jgi:hypothetical protein
MTVRRNLTMGLLEAAIRAVEATPLPDPVTRMGVEFLVGRTPASSPSRRLRIGISRAA